MKNIYFNGRQEDKDDFDVIVKVMNTKNVIKDSKVEVTKLTTFKSIQV